MSDIYSASVYVQIKSPCKKRSLSPLSKLLPLDFEMFSLLLHNTTDTCLTYSRSFRV